MKSLATVLLLSFIQIQTSAAATLLTDPSGQLLGAQDVDVDGRLYNVTFIDDSPRDIFADATNFDASNFADASLFADALLNQVLIGVYSDDQTRTSGCESSNVSRCNILTPYSLNTNTGILESAAAVNWVATTQPGFDDTVSLDTTSWSYDTSADNRRVYADWQLAVVPIPAAAWLFGSALLGLAGIARRAKSV